MTRSMHYQALTYKISIKWRYNCKYENLTIVSSEKSISVLILELPIDILLSLLDGNVHVTIQAGQDTCTKYQQARVLAEDDVQL